MQQKYAVFTMDVEAFWDTECVVKTNQPVQEDLLDGLDEYLALLEKHNIKSTLFMVGSLASKLKEKIQYYMGKGHELALHNAVHIAPMDESVEEFKSSLLECKGKMEELFHTSLIGFRAPFFSLDAIRLEVVRELGFAYDSSCLNFGLAPHTVSLDLKGYGKLAPGIYQNNGFFEFQLPNQKMLGTSFPICGGAYVRMCPWGLMKRMIKRHIKKGDYYVFYLHPFELTTQKVPKVKKLRAHEQLYLQRGISEYKNRIEQIIEMLKEQGYEFLTFQQLSQKLKQEEIG